MKKKGYQILNMYYSGEKLMGTERNIPNPLIRGVFLDSPDTLLGVFQIPKPFIETKFGITKGKFYEIRPLIKNYFEGDFHCLEMVFANESDNEFFSGIRSILLDDIPFPLDNLYKKLNNQTRGLHKGLSYPSEFLSVLQSLSVINDFAEAGFSDFKIKEDFFYTDFLDYHNDYAQFDQAYNVELVNFIEKKKERLKEKIYRKKERLIVDKDYRYIDNFIIKQRLKYYDKK